MDKNMVAISICHSIIQKHINSPGWLRMQYSLKVDRWKGAGEIEQVIAMDRGKCGQAYQLV